jgi:hypothetical protein
MRTEQKEARGVSAGKSRVWATPGFAIVYTADSAAASEYTRMARVCLSREELAEWLNKEALWS